MTTTNTSPPLSEAAREEQLQRVIADVVAPSAARTDAVGEFPRAAIRALGDAGLLGLVSSTEVGGLGGGHREASMVIEELAKACGSTAMVVLMHYAATAVIEAHGPVDIRERIARGDYLAALAFSETGSRSQFWVPLSTATRSDRGVQLDAKKSWVTSGGEADGYVWSTQALAVAGASTLWLVPAGTPGLRVSGGFDGFGLRGNASSPMEADRLELPVAAMLGADGGGMDLMMGVVLPFFQLMSASFSVGLMDAAVSNTIAHATATRFEHLDETLAASPTVRADIARMRIRTDVTRSFLLDCLSALESGDEAAMLRVLEVKAAAGEAAIDVTDLAMRICGGAAFRKEVGVERQFRDARASAVMAPTSGALHEFIGRAVCGLPLFG